MFEMIYLADILPKARSIGSIGLGSRFSLHPASLVLPNPVPENPHTVREGAGGEQKRGLGIPEDRGEEQCPRAVRVQGLTQGSNGDAVAPETAIVKLTELYASLQALARSVLGPWMLLLIVTEPTVGPEITAWVSWQKIR